MHEKFNFKEIIINGVPHNVYSEVEIRPVFGLWTKEDADRFEVVEVVKSEETGEEIERRVVRTEPTYGEARMEAINLIVDWHCAEQGVG